MWSSPEGHHGNTNNHLFWRGQGAALPRPVMRDPLVCIHLMSYLSYPLTIPFDTRFKKGILTRLLAGRLLYLSFLGQTHLIQTIRFIPAHNDI